VGIAPPVTPNSTLLRGVDVVMRPVTAHEESTEYKKSRLALARRVRRGVFGQIRLRITSWDRGSGHI
jgi:hypothetical protein